VSGTAASQSALTTLTAALERNAVLHGGRTAVLDDTQSLTWSRFIERVAASGGMLQELGLAQGDHYGILAPNSWRQAELIYAGYWTGAVPVPVNYRLAPAEIREILADAGCSMIAVDPGFAGMLDSPELADWRTRHVRLGADDASDGVNYDQRIAAAQPAKPAKTGPDDEAILLYTGGTTGKAKGVPLSHRNILANARQIGSVWPASPEDVVLHLPPMFHSAELVVTLYMLEGAANLYLARFDPGTLLQMIEKHGVTFVLMVPTVLMRVLDSGLAGKYDLDSLRQVIYGASPLSAEGIQRALETFPHVQFAQGYGLTETAPLISMLDHASHLAALASGGTGYMDQFASFLGGVAAQGPDAIEVWNEPNIYPEWGEYPVSAQEYTGLLKEGYTRIKAVDPDAIVVMGALAATIELDRVRRYNSDGLPVSPGGLSDVLFLQQMYNAGAAPYFDVLAMQGYGLWSGPTDRRMQPRVLNFSRPLYIRDVMVRNGDAHKAIWLSELSWNALPPDSGLPPVYGQVMPEQQARYAALAYQRMQREWPWLGVGFYWFFKQADDRERDSNPQYYFRMVEPDFTPMPVYHALKEQANQPPVMYAGWHQAQHWAVTYTGNWESVSPPEAAFGDALSGQPGDTARFTFEGSRLSLVVGGNGRLRVEVDQMEPVEIAPTGQSLQTIAAAGNLSQSLHRVKIEVLEGPVVIDGVIVENNPSLILNRAGSVIMVLAALGGVWVLWQKQRREG